MGQPPSAGADFKSDPYNTEIDHELQKTIASLRETELTVALLHQRIGSERRDTDVHLEMLRHESRRSEATLDRNREQLTAIDKSVTELRTDFTNLKRDFDDDRKQRRVLWAGIILAFVAAILGLTRDWISRAVQK